MKKTATVTIRVSKAFKDEVKAAIKHKLDITDDRTEEQLRADNDCTCTNCKHHFPYDPECDTCEQPNGPCTTRSNWTFRGIKM